MTAPLDLLLKYLSKVGKVKVHKDETGTRIEWKLKPLAFFWAKTYDGGIRLSVKRFSFEDYIQISTGIGYCRVTVVARLYFKDVEFPEEFFLNECKIYFNSKKLITIYFSDVQYQRCCDSPSKGNMHISDEEEEDEDELEELCGDIYEIYEEEMEDLEEYMEDLYKYEEEE